MPRSTVSSAPCSDRERVSQRLLINDEPELTLSTPVDYRRPKRRAPRTSAADMRDRLLGAARGAFSKAGFDQLGVRDLAAAAGVDAAIVIRAFGSKQALFTAIADEAFALEAPFEGPNSTLGLRVAQRLTGKVIERGPDQLDGFQFLVRSAASPTAAPILSAALHKGFIAPLAKLLGGPDASMRAALMASVVLGFATLRVALGSSALESGSRAKLTERLGAALQACVGAKPGA